MHAHADDSTVSRALITEEYYQKLACDPDGLLKDEAVRAILEKRMLDERYRHSSCREDGERKDALQRKEKALDTADKVVRNFMKKDVDAVQRDKDIQQSRDEIIDHLDNWFKKCLVDYPEAADFEPMIILAKGSARAANTPADFRNLGPEVMSIKHTIMKYVRGSK